MLLISHPLELLHINYLFFLQCLQLLSETPLFILEDLEFELVYLLLLVDVDAERVAVSSRVIRIVEANVALNLVHLRAENVLLES